MPRSMSGTRRDWNSTSPIIVNDGVTSIAVNVVALSERGRCSSRRLQLSYEPFSAWEVSGKCAETRQNVGDRVNVI